MPRTSVAERAAAVESQRVPRAGMGERFSGYGVMGLPFASGHVLAMRRFPASSVGPAYTSVWHRDPGGAWEFWQDSPPELACPRYFSDALAASRHVPVELDWTGPSTLRVVVPEVGLEWTSTFRTSVTSSALNAVSSVLPERLWRAEPVLRAMGVVAGTALRAGRVGLVGRTPNGQRFVASPRTVWLVERTAATLRGEDLGPTGALDEQAALGDFRIPQRGVLALGDASFTDGPPPGPGGPPSR